MRDVIRVLYVDDETSLRDVGMHYLGKTGEFSVDAAPSAQDALDLIAKKGYDVIVSDYKMPGMDGICFLKQFRSADKFTPFIIFTGKGEEDVVIDALNSGATFYLRKGDDLNTLYVELGHMIRQAVRMRRTQVSLAEQEQRIHDLQNAGDLIQSVAPDGHFLFVNKKWLDTLGYNEAEVKLLTIFDIIHRESLQHCMDIFRRVIAGENVGIITAVFRTRDGKRVYVEGLANCKLIEGVCQYTRGTFRDITHEKEAEAAVRAMVAGMVGTTGMEALDHMAQSISTWLSAECIMIGEISPNGERVRVLSMLLDGKKVIDYIFPLKGTPCENIVEKGTCMYEDDVAGIFPASRDLKEFKIRGYIGTALRNPDGEVTGILSILTRKPLNLPPSAKEIIEIMAAKAAVEIERMSVQLALSESEEKFRTLVENSLDGTIILEPKGKILFANSAAGRIVAAKNLDQIIRKKNVMEFIAPESQADVLRDFSEVARGVDGFLARYRIITLQDQERWVESIGKSIIFENAPAILISLRDITERHRADAAIRQSEEMFRTMFENSPYPIAINSMPDLKFIAVNPAFLKISGYSEEEVLKKNPVGMGILTLMESARLVSEVVRKGKVENVPLSVTAKEGRKIHVIFSSCPVTIDGRSAGMTMVVEVTGLKRVEDALRQANKKLKLLSSITRHDINNQLLTLNGYVEILNIKIHDPAYKSCFARIKDASFLIGAMIRFTKEYEMVGVNNPVWQDLQGLANDAVKSVTSGKVTIKNNLPPGAEVFADPLIAKVFYNLLDNAIRHGGGKISTIQFSLEKTEGDQIIVCEDDGDGIASGNKEQVFELGFGKNTGFGLAISREILDITGIGIRETGMAGAGARFEIIVPQEQFRSITS